VSHVSRIFVINLSERPFFYNLDMKDDVEEITWQTYSGELTPKQEKTKEKVLKRLEKVSIFVPNHFFPMQNHIFSWYFLVT